MQFFKRHKVDLFILLIIAVASLFVSWMYLQGTVLNTGYQDWMYHAYRALSLKNYGLLSWDNVWDNGLSYWRGYQLFGAYLTVAMSVLTHLSITKAMLVITVFSFIIFHAGIYLAGRSFGLKRAYAFAATGMMLGMTNFWLTTGSFSIMFAAVFVPYLLILWQYTRTHARLKPWFALTVGLSVYIHPLLAICAGLLWLIGLFIDSRTGVRRRFFIETLIVVLGAFFYWYTLVFVDYGAADPYQLSAEFLRIVSGLFSFNLIFYILGGLTLLGAILRPAIFKQYSQYLFWLVVIIYVLNLLTINVPGFTQLNRFQLYRIGFFIAPAICILFCELAQHTLSKVPRKVYTALAIIVFVAGVTQGFIYSGIYGNETSSPKASAVADYFKGKPAPTGGVYTTDISNTSYLMPNVRISSGYNDQLLPQQVNVRLAKLLGTTAPNYSISTDDLATIGNYIQVLGIQYVFLPQNSPYIQPLKASLGFKQVATLDSDDYSQTVLTPPWKTGYATQIDCSQVQSITTPKYPLVNADTTSAKLDAAVQTANDLINSDASSAITTSFPAKDKITLTVKKSSEKQCILLNQSYSRHWYVSGASVQATSDGMMRVTVNANSPTTLTLTHGWGILPYLQAFFLVVAVFIAARLGALYIRKGHHE